MAMRPRGGRGGPNRDTRFIGGRVYEPFKPMSEWRHEDDYDTLFVYLPGFQKEYIKVTTEALNIVRVRGERLVVENIWSRFQESFRFPEKCEMSGVRIRFDGGILIITMPRKKITAPQPPPTTTRVAPKSEKPPPPTTTTTTRVAPKSEKPPPSTTTTTTQVAPKSEKPPPPTTTQVSPKSENPPPPITTTTRVAPKSEKPPSPPITTRVAPKSEKPPPPTTTRVAPKYEKPPPPTTTTTTTRVAPKSEKPPPPTTTSTRVAPKSGKPPPPTTTRVAPKSEKPPPPTTTRVAPKSEKPPPPTTTTTTRVAPKSEKPPPPTTTTTRVAPKSKKPPPPTTTTRVAPKSENPPPPPTTTRVASKSEKPPPPPTTTTTTRVAPKSEKTPPPPTTTTRVAPKSEKPPPPPPTTTQVAPKSEEPPFTRIKQQETLAQKPQQDLKERATSLNNVATALEFEKKPEKPQTPPLLDEGGSMSTLPVQSQPQPMPTKQEPSKTAEAGREFTFGSLSSSIPEKDKEDGTIEKPNNKRKSKEAVVQEEKKPQPATSLNNVAASLEFDKKPEKPQTSLLLDEGGSTSTLPVQSQPQPMPTKQEPSKTAEVGGEFTFGSLSSSIPEKDKEDGTIMKPNDKGKSKEAVIEEKNKMCLAKNASGSSDGGKVEENAVVKGGDGWRGLNEDRKMVVNMGVGVLVIVALGIHVSYTIGLISTGK